MARRPHRGSAGTRRAAGLLALILLGAGALLGVRAEPAAACSCVGFTPQQAYDRAQAVFAGSLVEIEPAPPGFSGAIRTLRFTVDRVYKGNVDRQVVVRTAESSASCGLGLEALGPYVIFATGRGDTFSSTLCDTVVSGAAPASLGTGRTPADGGSGAGTTARSPSTEVGSGSVAGWPPWAVPLLVLCGTAAAVVVTIQVLGRRRSSHR